MNDHNIFNPDFSRLSPAISGGADDADTLFAADSTRIPQTKRVYRHLLFGQRQHLFMNRWSAAKMFPDLPLSSPQERAHYRRVFAG